MRKTSNQHQQRHSISLRLHYSEAGEATSLEVHEKADVVDQTGTIPSRFCTKVAIPTRACTFLRASAGRKCFYGVFFFVFSVSLYKREQFGCARNC